MPLPTPGRIWTVLLAIAGGLVTYCAFPNQGIWPAAWVGVGALFIALGRNSARWAALVGLCWGAAFLGPHMYWARIATDTVPWLVLTAGEAAIVAAGCATWVWIRRFTPLARHGLTQALGFALCFTATEQLRSQAPFGGMPWGRLAFSQLDAPTVRLARIGGEVLLTFVTAAIGALIAVGLMHLARRQWAPLAWCAAAAAVGLASGQLVTLDNEAQAGTLRVGAVQGNVADPSLGANTNSTEVLNNHITGTSNLLDQVHAGDLDLIVWPEDSAGQDPQTNANVANAIDTVSRGLRAPVLVGSQEYPKSGGRYNVVLLWEPGKGVIARYAKQHPAPFGEYIPMRSVARLVSKQVDRVNTDMIAGRGPAYIDLPSLRLDRMVRLGTVICFEVAYEPVVDQSVRDGAQILIVPTNNASFGYSAESTQQLAMSRLRAISTGRSTIQISTVGVSAAITPDGMVSHRTKLFTADQFVVHLPLRTAITPAVRIGAWPGYVVMAVTVLLAAAGIASSLIARRRSLAPQDPHPGAGTVDAVDLEGMTGPDA